MYLSVSGWTRAEEASQWVIVVDIGWNDPVFIVRVGKSMLNRCSGTLSHICHIRGWRSSCPQPGKTVVNVLRASVNSWGLWTQGSCTVRLLELLPLELVPLSVSVGRRKLKLFSRPLALLVEPLSNQQIFVCSSDVTCLTRWSGGCTVLKVGTCANTVSDFKEMGYPSALSVSTNCDSKLSVIVGSWSLRLCWDLKFI